VEHPWPFGNETTVNQIMALKTMGVEQALSSLSSGAMYTLVLDNDGEYRHYTRIFLAFSFVVDHLTTKALGRFFRNDSELVRMGDNALIFSCGRKQLAAWFSTLMVPIAPNKDH
jgi:hypothetical protein